MPRRTAGRPRDVPGRPGPQRFATTEATEFSTTFSISTRCDRGPVAVRGSALPPRLIHGICDACFSDEYPIAAGEDPDGPQLSLFRPPVEVDDSDA